MMNLSPKFSIGLATSAPFRRSNESSISFAASEERGLGPQTIKMDYRPEIKLSFPVKFSFYYSFLSRTRFRARMFCGIGYYPGELAEYYKHIITGFGGPVPVDGWLSYDWNAEAKYPFGFHAGLGLEYLLSNKLFLVMDIQVRYIRTGNLKGRREYRLDDGTFLEEKGTLYYINYWDLGIKSTYSKFDIWETSERAGERVGDFKKAVLDLSGFSLKAGIRISLF
jgi:hypothetical protein